jgi:hypothetical protein
MKVGDLITLSAYGKSIKWLDKSAGNKIGIIFEHGDPHRRTEYLVKFTDGTSERFYRKEIKHAK